jgi:DNA polymerase III subunit epsilon
MSVILAIDFETANYNRDSACAVGLALVQDRQIVNKNSFLIRPPNSWFVFTHIHGLTWKDVEDAPTFVELWPTLQSYLEAADYLAAHNAAFDRSVLNACCESGGLRYPDVPFVCTVNLARSRWDIYPTKLPNVCSELGIRLKHHDASSDANACAEIILAAQREGWRP